MIRYSVLALIVLTGTHLQAQPAQRFLYVAAPTDASDPDRSIRVLIFDTTAAHHFVKRVVLWQPAASEDREMVRGMAAAVKDGRLFLSTTRQLASLDLRTGTVNWRRSYEDHCCDRITISPDGQTIYAPAFGSPKWYVVQAATGELRGVIDVVGWPREGRYAPDGRRVYLAPWESETMSVVDAATQKVIRTVGPFSGFLCPFTLNPQATMTFANVDGLVGFEVGDVETGLVLDSVMVDGADRTEAAKYECPSHGIAFTPDGRELWVADGVQNRLHVFDATAYPPAWSSALDLPGQPRWIAFSLDGRYVYPSTGDVVDATRRQIVGTLRDETGRTVGSEVLMEIESAVVHGSMVRTPSQASRETGHSPPRRTR